MLLDGCTDRSSLCAGHHLFRGSRLAVSAVVLRSAPSTSVSQSEFLWHHVVHEFHGFDSSLKYVYIFHHMSKAGHVSSHHTPSSIPASCSKYCCPVLFKSINIFIGIVLCRLLAQVVEYHFRSRRFRNSVTSVYGARLHVHIRVFTFTCTSDVTAGHLRMSLSQLT